MGKDGRSGGKWAISRRFADLQTAFPSRQTGFACLPTVSAGLPAAFASLPTGFPSREKAFAGQPMAFCRPAIGRRQRAGAPNREKGEEYILGPQPRAALRLPWAIFVSSLPGGRHFPQVLGMTRLSY